MSFFSKILDKLGLNKDKAADAAQEQSLKDMAKREADARAKMQSANPATSTPASMPKPAAPTAAPAAPKAISEVDVVKQLETLGKGKGLDWKVSIVDLLKLLDIDSSREARNELATELGCPPELMSDSAKMNVWLHKTVLKKIAENGGNIPKDLLD